MTNKPDRCFRNITASKLIPTIIDACQNKSRKPFYELTAPTVPSVPGGNNPLDQVDCRDDLAEPSPLEPAWLNP